MIETGILVQLPSKDLWRGFDPARRKRDNMDTTPAKITSTEEAQALAGSECLWCGMKFDTTDLLKAHVESLHFLQQNFREVVKEYMATGQLEGAPVNLGSIKGESK